MVVYIACSLVDSQRQDYPRILWIPGLGGSVNPGTNDLLLLSCWRVHALLGK